MPTLEKLQIQLYKQMYLDFFSIRNPRIQLMAIGIGHWQIPCLNTPKYWWANVWFFMQLTSPGVFVKNENSPIADVTSEDLYLARYQVHGTSKPSTNRPESLLASTLLFYTVRQDNLRIRSYYTLARHASPLAAVAVAQMLTPRPASIKIPLHTPAQISESISFNFEAHGNIKFKKYLVQSKKFQIVMLTETPKW